MARLNRTFILNYRIFVLSNAVDWQYPDVQIAPECLADPSLSEQAAR